MSAKGHFSRFLERDDGLLHVAAHSHHPWPDVAREAHLAAWDDAARMQDRKWGHVFGEVLPEAQGHVARVLGLPDPATVAVAPSTHELVTRVLSCLDEPFDVLTTDAEFHSFARQAARLEEAGRARVTRVPAEPFETFPTRLAAAAVAPFDVVVLSHVQYDSGYVHPDLVGAVGAVGGDTLVLVDGYHGFMAVPTDLSALADRAFYTAGGYKYAMAGEGVCFMHCPPGVLPRPVDTGWFAGFGALEAPAGRSVGYPPDGRRFLGSTFDPSGLYRFNAVQRWLSREGLTVEVVRAHVLALQARFLERVDEVAPAGLRREQLLPDHGDRGSFCAFARPDAGRLASALARAGVIVDHRGERIRFGFGIYHEPADVDELVARLVDLER